LLSLAPKIECLPSHQGFIANLTKCITQVANGNINAFSDLIGIWSGTIRRLLAGETNPRLEVICRICERLRIPVLDLLTDFDGKELGKHQGAVCISRTPPPKEKVPWREIEGRLHAALKERPPSCLEEVASRLGYSPSTLRDNFRELCATIVSRYKEHLISKHPEPREVRKVFRAALAESPPPSLQSVFRRLRCKDTGYYYYYNYRELCLAVALRFKSYRNKPFNKDSDREQLQAALIEEPPPSLSEMAVRLGHKREFLRRKFPELSQSIVSRHMYYRTACYKEQAKRLRREIRRAIKHLMKSGLSISEARVRKEIIRRLPGPGRDSLFKQALREIKTEKGLNG